jgi:hypothetical protein
MSIAGVHGVSLSGFGFVGRYTKLVRVGNVFGFRMSRPIYIGYYSLY